jgi:L-amino acid N-acyltransferase
MNIRQEKYNVTEAHQIDLKRITEILNQAIIWGNANAYTETFNENERMAWFNMHTDGRYNIFVAKHNDRVVGYLSISPYRKGRQAFQNTAEVSYYVDFDYHNKGIASLLMQHAFKYCQENNLKILLAFLYGHNEQSISFLKKFEFKKWGLLPGAAIVNGKKFDHVIYGKRIV